MRDDITLFSQFLHGNLLMAVSFWFSLRAGRHLADSLSQRDRRFPLVAQSSILGFMAIVSAASGAGPIDDPAWHVVKDVLLVVLMACLTIVMGKFVWTGLQKQVRPVPAWRAMLFCQWFLSKKTYARIAAPILRDMMDEHVEALAQGQHWKARWIILCGYFNLTSSLLLWLPVSTLGKLARLFGMP